MSVARFSVVCCCVVGRDVVLCVMLRCAVMLVCRVMLCRVAGFCCVVCVFVFVFVVVWCWYGRVCVGVCRCVSVCVGVSGVRH